MFQNLVSTILTGPFAQVTGARQIDCGFDRSPRFQGCRGKSRILRIEVDTDGNNNNGC